MAVEIVMPRLSDSMEEGTIVQWLVAAGDAVTEGTPLVEVETDKATMAYESEHDGTILRLVVSEGESVAVGVVIATLGEAGESFEPSETDLVMGAATPNAAIAATPADATIGTASAEVAVGATAAAPRVKASPLARRVALALGVDLATLAGSGPQGRVIRADVERGAATGATQGEGTSKPGRLAPRDTTDASDGKGTVTVTRLTRVQQTIARRMSESRSTVPDFELRNEYDMSAIVALREQLQEATEQPPSYNDFIVKAVALALREFPRINGSYRTGAFETYERVNIGVAVAADDALVVPTIFDADMMSVGAIGATARTLAAKVRDGSITPAELSGSTFSVSNLGMYGVDSFSAVIDAPQAAILAVGALKPRPVVAEDGVTVVARPTVHVSLACDHRIVYGADGARFLQRLGELMAAPSALLL